MLSDTVVVRRAASQSDVILEVELQRLLSDADLQKLSRVWNIF